jgi:hypothetical protein
MITRDNVISQLIDAIRNSLNAREMYQSSPIQLRRSLLVLLHIFKEVSQNRIGPGRSKLKSYSSELLSLLSSVYFGSFNVELIQTGLDSGSGLDIPLEEALLSFKIMRRIIVLFIDNIPGDPDVKTIWNESLSSFRSVIDIALAQDMHARFSSDAVQYLHRNLGQIAKFHVSMAKDHFSAFVALQQSYEVIQMHWKLVSILGQKFAVAAGYPAVSEVVSTVHDFDEIRKTLVDKLGLQSLLLLRACIKWVALPSRSLRYRTEMQKKDDKDASLILMENVFTETAVIELVNHIVAELFLFQPNDLREWEEEPDEWEKREELSGEDFEFAARPCSEKLLLDLTIHFKDSTIPHLLKMLQTVTGKNNESNRARS